MVQIVVLNAQLSVKKLEKPSESRGRVCEDSQTAVTDELSEPTKRY
jgi:hypothetical protein